MSGPLRPRCLAVLFAATLAGCGDSPPSDRARAEIEKAVLGANTAMFEGGPGAADVVDIAVAGWQQQESTGTGLTSYTAQWNAKLRFKEPIACILMEVDGTRIVRVVADKGEQLPFRGQVGAMRWENKWEVNASVDNDGDFTGPGAWRPIADRVPGLTMGYQVIQQGNQVNPRFRTCNFEPLSRLQPCIVEGSPEHAKLEAESQERWRKAQQAEAARQQALQQERERLQAEAAERQRLAAEAQERKRVEEAERQRVAAETARNEQEAARSARLLAVMKPFQTGGRAAITADAGLLLGAVILDASVDAEKLSVSGRAIDLREMPFSEFTFEGSVDPRGAFACKTSRGGDAVQYAASGDKLVSRAGYTIAALADPDRARVESLIELGRRLGSAPAAELRVETLDADAAAAREPELRLGGLSGTVFHRGRSAPAVAPLFAADLGAKKAYVWRNQEIVAIRLGEPVQGRALYIRGSATPSTECAVTINGIHQCTVASIPKLGGVLVSLPADLEVLDLRLQANGTVSARTIGLVR